MASAPAKLEPMLCPRFFHRAASMALKRCSRRRLPNAKPWRTLLAPGARVFQAEEHRAGHHGGGRTLLQSLAGSQAQLAHPHVLDAYGSGPRQSAVTALGPGSGPNAASWTPPVRPRLRAPIHVRLHQQRAYAVGSSPIPSHPVQNQSVTARGQVRAPHARSDQKTGQANHPRSIGRSSLLAPPIQASRHSR